MGNTQLQKLEKQREALNKKIAEQKRKNDYRRRYLIGMVIEKAIADKKINPQSLKEHAKLYVKKQADRELLNLTSLENIKVQEEPQNNSQHQ